MGYLLGTTRDICFWYYSSKKPTLSIVDSFIPRVLQFFCSLVELKKIQGLSEKDQDPGESDYDTLSALRRGRKTSEDSQLFSLGKIISKYKDKTQTELE